VEDLAALNPFFSVRLRKSIPAKKAEKNTKPYAVVKNPMGWSVKRRNDEGE
jgi:hypothetical protein